MRSGWSSVRIDEIKGNVNMPDYSEEFNAEFLEAHPTLVVDTQHFDDGFAARLLEAIGDVDRQTDGVLFNGDNFQSLVIMQQRYREAKLIASTSIPHTTLATRKFHTRIAYLRSVMADPNGKPARIGT